MPEMAKGEMMRYKTVTERIGEYLGPVDWDGFDFQKAVAGMYQCSGGAERLRQARIDRFRKLCDDPDAYLVSTYGGIPRIYHELYKVGMYDGWPYWKPYPSVCLKGTLGPEWRPFHSITNIKHRETKEVS